MLRPSRPSPPLLSYLVGPGPREAGARATVRVGLSNLGERLREPQLALILSEAGSRRVLARAEWTGLLARRSARELELCIDRERGRLQLAGHVVDLDAGHADGWLLRAELRDARRAAPDVLEIGLAAAAVAAGAGRP